MTRRKLFPFLLLVLAALLAGARPARACSCGPRPTVLDAFERAQAVVIVRVAALQKLEAKAEGKPDISQVVSATMVVEKVYKGTLKVGDEMTFTQGGGADCVWTFDDDDVGQRLLFYPHYFEKGNVWVASICARGTYVQYATEDLLYLDNLDTVRGKTRVSGRVSFGAETSQSVEGLKVRIIGPQKTHVVETDANGVYEIYDLPAGKYAVEPEAPFGWKLSRYWQDFSPSAEGKVSADAPRQIPFVLEEKKHVSLNIRFEIDNAIRGSVYGPDGKPMQGVCVKALPVQGEMKRGFHQGCSDRSGKFSITEVARGSYILAVNDDGQIDADEPFERFYYPDAVERDKAAVITIGEGEFRDDINIHVPRVKETVAIRGVVLYSDGKPAESGVEFTAENAGASMEGDVRESTDAGGRFTLKVLKGLKGRLHGEMYAYADEYKNCPKLESIIKKMGGDGGDVTTPAVEIRADNDLYNVELRFPFPSCKKAD